MALSTTYFDPLSPNPQILHYK